METGETEAAVTEVLISPCSEGQPGDCCAPLHFGEGVASQRGAFRLCKDSPLLPPPLQFSREGGLPVLQATSTLLLLQASGGGGLVQGSSELARLPCPLPPSPTQADFPGDLQALNVACGHQ